MRARREAPEWKQWNSTSADNFANTAGFFPAGQQIIIAAAPGPIHGGPFSVSFPADQGQLAIGGGAPLPIQINNEMAGNSITMRKLTFFFSWKLIPVDVGYPLVPPITLPPATNTRNMNLGQSLGIGMIFCRF
jgi:hypothetical protein